MSLLTLSIPFGLIGADALARELGAEAARGEVRRFPDGEWYVRIDSPVVGRDVAVVCPLDQPDEKFLAASLAAGTARDLGASRVGIVAPYLAYMRQDCRFRRGEGVTSAYFARLISSTFDWLVTVDPHLHRRASLGEIYSIPTRVAHAAPLLAAWINGNVEKPLLVGPDGESEQWVSAVAEGAGAPYVVLEKTRRGDRDVEIALPSVGRYAGRTPVLVDDIVSTATTMSPGAAAATSSTAGRATTAPSAGRASTSSSAAPAATRSSAGTMATSSTAAPATITAMGAAATIGCAPASAPTPWWAAAATT